ncbi:MAG: PaaI family thioesterase [Nitriliruptoraceae bacterium]
MTPPAPRASAAEAVRRLGHALMAHDVDDALLARVDAVVGALADEAAAFPQRHRDVAALTERMFTTGVPDGTRVVHFDECVVSGPWNPLGIGLEVVRDGEDAVAEVVLGTAFEGGPGMAHGGIVAALFDDLLGYLLTLHHVPGFTGELAVRYHRPTPVGVPLALHGWVVDRVGRRLLTAGDIRADGQVVASATATFVEVDRARIQPPA